MINEEQKIHDGKSIIDVQNLSWERDKTILKDVTWQVNKGEHWCLVGLNGSGKTSLLNIINGYNWPTSGKVRVLGHRFGEYDLRELRKEIGWVSTSLQQRLYGKETALAIVLSGKFASIGLYEQPQEADKEKAVQLLTFLGCETLVHQTYDTLSQGERQRVLIARALMASPKLLILDEPCTGLDIFAREQLLQMIEKIANQPDAPTLIYVTHHIEEILPCFNQTLLLKAGEVFEAGHTEEILTSDRLSRFFDVPIKAERRDQRTWVSIDR